MSNNAHLLPQISEVMLMAKILAISTVPDPHIDMVQKHLDTEIHVFDPKVLIKESKFSYSLFPGEIRLLHEAADIANVKSVWFRKPFYPSPEDFPVEDKYRDFSVDSYTAAAKSLYDLLGRALWVSSYRAIMRANNKLMQQQLANALGFWILKTLVTNDPRAVEDFRASADSIVTKSLVFSPVYTEDGAYGFFTRRIPRESVLDLDGLALAPAIFQEEVPNKRDIRVTVVGEKAFACELKATGSVANRVDWRQGIKTGEVVYTVHTHFPKAMVDLCIAYVQRLGLRFGVVEFALDENGVYWFLEINPNGQWAFIEIETGLEISKEIANLLSSPFKQ